MAIRMWTVLGSGLLLASAGCGTSFFNQTASLGGTTAGERGDITLLFVNNTPHQPVFTFGTYDNSDRKSEPVFRQFDLNGNDLALGGNAVSGFVDIQCARVLSIGGASLREFIDENIRDPELSEDAYVDGVHFYRTVDDPESGDPVLIGTAPPLEPLLLGADFPCGSLLIFRFEFDDVGPEEFRVEFEVIPAESTR